MEKVFYLIKHGEKLRFKLAKNTPAPIVNWVRAQPKAIYRIERKLNGLEIVVNDQGRHKFIPWRWIAELRYTGDIIKMELHCNWCGSILWPGDGYMEYQGLAFCWTECVKDYIMSNAKLVEKVVGEDDKF